MEGKSDFKIRWLSFPLLTFISKALDITLIRDSRGCSWDQIIVLIIYNLENTVDKQISTVK